MAASQQHIWKCTYLVYKYYTILKLNGCICGADLISNKWLHLLSFSELTLLYSSPSSEDKLSSSLVTMSSSCTMAVSQKVALLFRSSLELEKMLTSFSARSFLKRFL